MACQRKNPDSVLNIWTPDLLELFKRATIPTGSAIMAPLSSSEPADCASRCDCRHSDYLLPCLYFFNIIFRWISLSCIRSDRFIRQFRRRFIVATVRLVFFYSNGSIQGLVNFREIETVRRLRNIHCKLNNIEVMTATEMRGLGWQMLVVCGSRFMQSIRFSRS